MWARARPPPCSLQAAHAGIEQLRERFEEVTQRNGLRGNAEMAEELAEFVTRPGGVTAEYVANVYQVPTYLLLPR